MATGSCHCGRVRFEVPGEPGPVLECNCSHCQRKGFLLWFVPREQLNVTQGEDTLTTYLFNQHVIQHRFCPHCGVQPFGLGTHPESGQPMAAINVRCLDDLELGTLQRIPVDGRSRP